MAKEVIGILDDSHIEELYHLHISASMFSMFAQISSEKKYFHKSISLYLKLLESYELSKRGRAETSVALGHTYHLLGDYENASKYLDESKKHEYLNLADIYMALVKIDMADLRTAKEFLSKIVYEDLAEEKFDYLLAYSLYILKVVSRNVRNLGTPKYELSCIQQQCLNRLRVQVRPRHRPVLGIFH